MSTNISKKKREDLLDKIKQIRAFIAAAPQDENTGNLLSYLSELEKDVNGKKYGLVFEEHREEIDEVLDMKDRPDGDRLGEIVEIMLDAVCSTAPTIRINGEDMPQQVVKSRFLKLDSSHIEYVFHAMKECPSNIRNIRAYLLTTLYNAPATMDNFYSAKVNHDFNGW